MIFGQEKNLPYVTGKSLKYVFKKYIIPKNLLVSRRPQEKYFEKIFVASYFFKIKKKKIIRMLHFIYFIRYVETTKDLENHGLISYLVRDVIFEILTISGLGA